MSRGLSVIKTLLLLGIGATLVFGFYNIRQLPLDQSIDPPYEDNSLKTTTMEIPHGSTLPVDKLIITPARQGYSDDQLVLKIPTLSIETTIKNGTEVETLKKGPGLYEYAQLPQEAGANVSIAGHRDVHGSIFYDLDKLQAGDLLYLDYEGLIYQYQYQETIVIEPDDWSVIFTKGDNRLTLTSCTPIGVSSHRIVIIGELVQVITPGDDFVYKAKIE